MGFLGFLKFSFNCLDLLARSLFGVGCPLYASIRAIENDSISEMRNLVAYWIIFSLISLIELVFVKLIDRLPFWPYMKLMVIFWLVLPHFGVAAYVYDRMLRPCLSMYPQVLIKHLIMPTKDLSLNTESFLSVAEKYIQENGSEALETLIDRKLPSSLLQSKDTKSNIAVEEIKAMTNAEEKETAAAIQFKFKEPSSVAKEDTRAVEVTEKNLAAVTKWSKFEHPNVAEENSNTGKLKEKNPAAAIEEVKCVEKNLTQTENKTVAAEETKEKTVTTAAGGGGNKVPVVTNSEKVQREWTCALCQVTTTCEKDLDSHLHGMKHRARCEELKDSKQVHKNKGSSSSAANQVPKKPIFVERPNQNKKNEEKVQYISEYSRGKQVNNPRSGANHSRFWCRICDVKCSGELDLLSHLRGQKHSLRIQSVIDSLRGGH